MQKKKSIVLKGVFVVLENAVNKEEFYAGAIALISLPFERVSI